MLDPHSIFPDSCKPANRVCYSGAALCKGDYDVMTKSS